MPTAETTAAADGLDPSIQTMLTNLADGYNAVDGVWKGFAPNQHPVVIAIKNTSSDPDKPITAVALNHPDPNALGDVTAIPTDGLPFNSVHMVENPADKQALETLDGFDFHATLGGIDSFAMVAEKGGDGFFDPETKDYVATLLHELFHRYQDQGFKGDVGLQDIEGYAYTASNLELAVLEERALTAALEATTDADRDAAAKRFAGLRLARLDADNRVALDNSQERFEGTARYIEHRLSQDAGEYTYHGGNYHGDLIIDFATNSARQGTKESFGFGRFYASGAAILAVLDRMGIEDISDRIEAGNSPADVLIAEVGVDATEMADLVAEAKANYDPLNQLAAGAASAAESAANEPPVFDDIPTGSLDGVQDGAVPGEVPSGAAEEITDEEFECLVAEGFDFENDIEITEAQSQACFA